MKNTIIYFRKSTRPTKKWMVTIDNVTIHFGASGYSDYTLHKNNERKQRYINRHKNAEKWTKSGIKTAGFWARWALWNKPSLTASLKDIETRFNVTIKRSNPPSK